MALTKRTYVDGETIITAQNLNDIQDEIISQGNTLVPKTRTINSKALSSNITLAAADVGAVPTTRTVNSKALSSNITLTSDDIGYNSSTTYTSGSVGKAVSDLNGALNQTEDQISAYIETGNNATRAYTKGQYVVWKGVLYEVTTDISSSAPFNTSTNLKETAIGTELSARAKLVKLADLPANGSMTIHTESGGKYLFISIANREQMCGIYLQNVTSGGISTFIPVLAASGYSFNTSAVNAPIITNSTAYSASCFAIPLTKHSIS